MKPTKEQYLAAARAGLPPDPPPTPLLRRSTMRTIRNGALAAAIVIAASATISATTDHKVTAHAAPLSPPVVRQLERTTGAAVKRAGSAVGGITFAGTCVHHPHGVEAIPGIGPALTARQCHPAT